MAQQRHSPRPFSTVVLGDSDGTVDALPAAYHYYEGKKRRVVINPAKAVPDFLDAELSLGILGEMSWHLWFSGSKDPVTQLHFQVAMGREIVVADRMELHLLWDKNLRIFLKPLPRFLLDPAFWDINLICVCEECRGALSRSCAPKVPCRKRGQRRVALGFLYTYACLVCSETDFFVANEKRLLPRQADSSTIEWARWKELVRRLLENHDPDEVHPRFLRAELRQSRINTVCRFTRLLPSLSQDTHFWMAGFAFLLGLELVMKQFDLAYEQLKPGTTSGGHRTSPSSPSSVPC